MSKKARVSTRPPGNKPPVAPPQRRPNIICIGIPLGEMVPTPFVRKSYETLIQGAQIVVVANGSYHTNTANQLVKDALEHPVKWDYLCFYEHDMVPSMNWLHRVAAYDAEKFDIIGSLYFRRNPDDQRPIPGLWDDETRRSYRALNVDELEYMVSRPGFHPVDCCGLGATAIHRRVFEAMPKNRWFHAPEGPSDDTVLCESHDVYFCREAQKLGFKVWLDTGVLAEHWGWYPFTIHSYREAVQRGREAKNWEHALSTDDAA